MMTFGLTQVLSMEIKKSPEEAPNYKQEGGWIQANLDKAIVVHNGMESGNSTVDLQFTDEKGNKYMCMVTGRLLKMVAQACITDNDD